MSDKNILVYCEVSDGNLSPVAGELLSAGRILAKDSGKEVTGVIIGSGLDNAGREAIAYGADKVYVIDNELLEEYLTDNYVSVIERVIQEVDPEIVLLSHTNIGKDLTPWLAFKLDTGAALDCIALAMDPESGRMLMTKPVYGGNAQAVQVCKTNPQLATVRIKVMEPLERDDTREGEVINMDVEIQAGMARQEKLGEERDSSLGAKLEDAKIIVSGGRGIGGEEGFRVLDELAGALNGVVGGSRPACDNKWVSDVVQIGLTGKIVSPELYIAVAISGSSQHMAGCSGSKVIIGVNKDPEANIFKYAHYGIVEDWRKIIPEITKSLGAR